MSFSVSEPRKKAVLDEFRQSLRDILQPQHDDYYLMRWLFANYTTDFDVRKSEADLRAHLKWREHIGADTILDWTPPEVLRRFYPGGLHGYDKRHCPIWIEPLGCSDVKGLMRSAKKTDILRLKVQHCEQIQQLIIQQRKKFGEQVNGLVVIFDLEHLGMHHLWKPAMNLYTEIVAMNSIHYPETLTRTYVINAPRIFPIAYNIVKPVLSEATKRKIIILGRNWKASLLQDIDADQLPVHWGGTATDPDGNPFCRMSVCMGGPVPREFYVAAHDAIDRRAFTHLTVANKSTAHIEFKVKVPDSTLQWQFVTEGCDIGFGIKRVAANASAADNKSLSTVIVVPTSRVNCNLVPEDGSLLCTEPGLYVVMFDNSYSWIHRKSVWYCIDIIEPPSSPNLSLSFGDSLLQS